MYIETVLSRLNAFRDKQDKRYAVAGTLVTEPYLGYSWEELLALSALYHHITDNGVIEISALNISLCLANRKLVETRDGYVLDAVFTGKTRLPILLLHVDGRLVYSRMLSGIDIRAHDGCLVAGTIIEKWCFEESKVCDRPLSIQQSIFIGKENSVGDQRDHTVGRVITTYELAGGKVIAEGELRYRTFFKDHFYAYKELTYSVYDGSRLVANYTPCDASTAPMLAMFDSEEKLRKIRDGYGNHSIQLFASDGRKIRKSPFNFITHRYELKSNEVDAALRKSGASRLDSCYPPTISVMYNLDCCPSFPIPYKEAADEEAKQ